MAITEQDLLPFLSSSNQSGNYPYLSMGNYNSSGATSQKTPYTQDGLYYWLNPTRRNPVPSSTVPAASVKPSSSYRKLADNTQALYDLMPYMASAVNQTAVPTALSQLAASQATSPGYAQLMLDLYNTYGPQLNAIGNEILGRNMMAEAQNQLNVTKGPGRDLVTSAYDLSQIYDKPYYDSRAKAASGLSSLFDSIDLSGGLSDTERNEIAQGLARSNISRGTYNAPSPINTISDAMRYGNAGYQRKTQQQNLLSDAIKQSSSFLPAAKSGVDVFQVATGKSSTANPGNSLFPGISNSNNSSSYGLAGNLFNSGTQYDVTQMGIDANKKDWLDQFNQFASGLGSIIGSGKSLI